MGVLMLDLRSQRRVVADTAYPLLGNEQWDFVQSALDRFTAAKVSHLVVACSVAPLAPLFGPAFTGRVFVYNDLAWFHLSTRHLYQQALHAGDLMLTIEAMKMETGLYADRPGTVKVLHVQPGAQVDAKDLLVELALE